MKAVLSFLPTQPVPFVNLGKWQVNLYDVPLMKVGLQDCRPNSWSINLPSDGPYRVEVQVGSPCEPKEGMSGCQRSPNTSYIGTRKYFLQANGQSIISGEELAKGKFFWATGDISITNKILTLTADCNAGEEAPEVACKTAITTLMNVKIIKVDTRKLAAPASKSVEL